MAKGNSNLPLLAILIGGLSDKFVRQTKIILESLAVEFVLCDNIYSAIGDLAKIDNQDVLIIARVGLLSKEQGRFFHIARAKGCRICCLADRELLRRQKLILKAIESGAYLIDKPAEIEEVVMKLLACDKVRFTPEQVKHRASGFLKDKFLTTKAELDALFEV